MLESVEGNTDAERALAKRSSNTSTNGTNNDVITRNDVCSPDETDDHPYKDVIFRIGKV